MAGALGTTILLGARSIFPKAPRALLGDTELMLSTVPAPSWICSSTVPRGLDPPKSAGAACRSLLVHECVCFCGFVLAG